MHLRLLLMVLFLAGTVHAQNLNTTLLANLNNYPNNGYTDVWGYQAPDGRAYALQGVNGGVMIADVTDPNAITEADFVPWVTAGWYDMKTYGTYLYVSTEGADRCLNVDLAPLPDSARVVGEWGDFATNLHNVFVDTAQGLLFTVEDFNFSRPVGIASLADPENPVEIDSLGAGRGRDAHDVFSQDSVLYVAEGVNGTIGIFDISDPANAALMVRHTIPNAGYVHNVWVSPDNALMVTTEETPGKTIKLWDISDVNNIVLLGEYLGESTLAHNAIFADGFLYISHYTSGIKIVDYRDPAFPVEVGNYDSHPQSDNPGFSGAWGVYPYPAGGMVFIGDMQTGLSVVSFNATEAYRVAGTVLDDVTGQPVSGAVVRFAGSGGVQRSDAAGAFQTGAGLSGPVTLEVAAFGYARTGIALTAVGGRTDTVTVRLQPAVNGELAGTVQGMSGAPVADARVRLTYDGLVSDAPVTLETTTDGAGAYRFADLPPSDGDFLTYAGLEIRRTFPYLSERIETVSIAAGQVTTRDFVLDPADLLLVNDAPLGGPVPAFVDALDSLGIRYYEWVTSSDGEAIPLGLAPVMQSPVVIWFTKTDLVDVLSQQEQDSLAVLLNAGGRLLLTGNNIAESLSSQGSPFLADYLKTSWEGNLASGPPLLRPVTGNPVGDSLGALNVAQSSRDQLSPLDNGASALTYFNGTGAAITAETSVYKSVLTGFGVEELQSGEQRVDFLGAVLDWFAVPTPIRDGGTAGLARELTLFQNYPNPFNPETEIRFALDGAAPVRLAVFNVLGERVRTLVDGRRAAGTHRVRWNGIDDAGRSVGSGVYFYRLESEGRQLTRRMLLVR